MISSEQCLPGVLDIYPISTCWDEGETITAYQSWQLNATVKEIEGELILKARREPNGGYKDKCHLGFTLRRPLGH